MGLYYPDGSFKEDTEIKRDLALKEANEHPQQPSYDTPIPEHKDFTYWNRRLGRRAREHQETDEAVKFAHITLPERPCLVSLVGDYHVGNYSVDHERIEQEVVLIKETPFSYVGAMGDLADHMFWNPSQAYDESSQFPDQVEWVNAMFRYLNDGESPNKLLFSIVGNHDDKWAKKTGMSLYHNFSQKFGAYLFRGPSVLELQLGEESFRGLVSHQFLGGSMYNPNHPQTRAIRDHGLGVDIDFIFSGHTHRKGIQQQSYGDGRRGKRVVAGNIGTYKRTDSYGEDKGFFPATEEEMFGLSFIYLPKPRYIIGFDDIMVAHEIFREHFL